LSFFATVLGDLGTLALGGPLNGWLENAPLSRLLKRVQMQGGARRAE
jgi:hypothetical protein